jgi:hypothetical protein
LEKHKEESGSGRLLRAASTFGASSGLVTSSWVAASRSGAVPSSNQGRNSRPGTSLRSRLPERAEEANSPFGGLDTIILGDHSGMALSEMGTQRCGAATTSLERRVAVLAGRPFGGCVVAGLNEVKPSPAPGLTFSGAAICRDGRGVNGGSRRRRAGTQEDRRKTLRSGIAEAGGKDSGTLDVCRLHRWEFWRDQWQDEVQKEVGSAFIRKRGSSKRQQEQAKLKRKDHGVPRG